VSRFPTDDSREIYVTESFGNSPAARRVFAASRARVLAEGRRRDALTVRALDGRVASRARPSDARAAPEPSARVSGLLYVI